MQSVFSAAGIMENLLLLINFLRLRSCLKSQECGFGKIFFQHFLPNLFNDCAFKFQGRRVCAKWGLFFSLFPVNSSCSGQETLRKMMYFLCVSLLDKSPLSFTKWLLQIKCNGR